MNEEKLFNLIRKFSSRLPKFPDGRINYKNSDSAIVLNVFVKYKEKILLLKRSNKVHSYKGKWNSIGGYIDELKPLKEKALEEIKEELGIQEDNVKNVKIGKMFKFYDKEIRMTWIVFPVLVELKQKPRIKIDWEHTDYKWIRPEEINKYECVPNLDKVWNNLNIEKI